MKSAPSIIIRQLLIDRGLAFDAGVSSQWPVFATFLPEDFDNAIAVYDTAGELQGRLMRDGVHEIKPGIQIRVRNLSAGESWKKANEIALNLDQLLSEQLTINGDDYKLTNFSRTGDILPMGMEEDSGRRRFNHTINAILTIQLL